ncbi:MAG TPA: M17 family peptidase N-terminal domain-containing protein, partial [Kofleriaceae bacterium]|nr:M17 family peptidase N-terminal domain-containing protein [Kofleriaceae bacterium]
MTQLTGPVLQANVDALAITTFGEPGKDPVFKSVDQALGGHLAEVAKHESFEGKTGQVLSLYTAGRIPVKRVIVVGAGARGDFANSAMRDVAASVAQAANKINAASVGFVLPQLGANREAILVQLAVEGLYEGTYKFARYLTGDDHKKPQSLKSFGIFTDAKGKKPSAAQARAFQTAVTRGNVVAAAVNHARDLINEPAAVITPTSLAADAQAIAKKHKGSLHVTVLTPKQCQELGMGMFLAVGQGSDQEPRFIHITYKPAKKPKKKICFIGKGVTFDSGGYSLKPSNAMEDMKIDMSGGAAVIAAMDAIATLGSDYEVHAVCAACENLVSGRA